MDDLATDCGAIFEATVFLSHFNDLPDPRQAVKVVYPLDEVLLLSLLAVLAGAETFTDIARFGDKKLALLRRFRPFHDGTPPHDRIGDIFAALDAEHFQRCFVAWVAALTGAPAKKGVAQPRSTWFRPSPHASVWSSAKSKWPKNPTKS
jgi:hypothetical protein